jgi:hypothetical protein
MLLEPGLLLERTDVESPDILAHAANTLMMPTLRINLNIMISSSIGATLQSGGEGFRARPGALDSIRTGG